MFFGSISYHTNHKEIFFKLGLRLVVLCFAAIARCLTASPSFPPPDDDNSWHAWVTQIIRCLYKHLVPACGENKITPQQHTRCIFKNVRWQSWCSYCSKTDQNWSNLVMQLDGCKQRFKGLKVLSRYIKNFNMFRKGFSSTPFHLAISSYYGSHLIQSP